MGRHQYIQWEVHTVGSEISMKAVTLQERRSQTVTTHKKMGREKARGRTAFRRIWRHSSSSSRERGNEITRTQVHKAKEAKRELKAANEKRKEKKSGRSKKGGKGDLIAEQSPRADYT